ncbi:peptidoglycan-binding protein [Streptomyces sp. NPDC056534]|uniref:peptidoglycan-binding protein n=1 Tax=Streptomyces sp. NPDC056534 TaxID=3345857 RepID=UPI0036CAC86F
MATPLTADQLLNALKDEGLSVAEYKNWRTHSRNHKGPWGPMNGVVIHHTAGRNSLNFCYNGSADLPGPLCHTHLAKDGKATMLSAGRANHAGTFAANAFNAMRDEAKTHPRPDAAEPIDGNRHCYGIEIENLGNGKDVYPAAQYDAAVRWAAAICRAHGWSAQSVIGHKEGTRRKTDPAGPIGKADGPMWDMTQFRADVQKRLDAKPTTPPKKPVPSKPTPKPVPVPKFPGTEKFGPGANNAYVTQLGKALVRKGYGRFYSVGPGPRWGEADRRATQAFQRAQGWTGADADGRPGPSTWNRLMK